MNFDKAKPEGVLHLIYRTFLDGCRDPQTLGMTLLAPSAIFILLWFVMSAMTAPTTLDIGVVNEDTGMGNVSLGNAFAGALGRQDNVSVSYLSRDAAGEAFKNGSIDGAIIFGPDFTKNVLTKKGATLQVIAEGTDQTGAMLLTKAVSAAATATAAQLQGGNASGLPVTIQTSKYFAAEMSPIDTMKPMIIGLVTFLLGFLVAFIFAFRRKAGALAAGLSGPVVATGYTLGLWAFSFVQGVTIMLYFQYGIGIGTTMDMISVSAMLLAVSLAAVACGVLAAGIARRGEQGIQLLIGFVILQIYFGGIAVEIGRFPDWAQAISYVMPLTYARHALMDIIARGYGFGDAWTDALALAVIAVVAVLLAATALGRKVAVKAAPEIRAN